MKNAPIEKNILFKSEYKVINLKYEYEGYCGTEKWAIVSELSEKELLEEYHDEIQKYIPFVLLSVEQGKAIKDYAQNEDKYKKRQLNSEDIFGYDEGVTERFHSETAAPDYWQEQDEQEERQARYDLLSEALDSLTIIQRQRLIKYVLFTKTLREIAAEEGVNFSKVDKSIKAGMKKIKEIFEKRGYISGV